MNSSGMDPSSPGGDIGNQMKAFLLLVILFIGFVFLSASELATVDLTPDTPAVYAAAPAVEEDVIVIPESTVPNDVVLVVPVTGTCTDPYIVRSGDMLSSIAEICNTTVANLRLANPEITNANLIYPGQAIRISAVAVIQPTVIPVTGQQPAPIVIQVSPPEVAVTVVPNQGQPPAPAVAAVPQLVPAIQPGTGMQVKGMNFPANTLVHIAIGPFNTGYNVVANGITDNAGNVTATIVVPTAPDPTSPWIVVVATISDPVIQAASEPFTITTAP